MNPIIDQQRDNRDFNITPNPFDGIIFFGSDNRPPVDPYLYIHLRARQAGKNYIQQRMFNPLPIIWEDKPSVSYGSYVVGCDPAVPDGPITIISKDGCFKCGTRGVPKYCSHCKL